MVSGRAAHQDRPSFLGELHRGRLRWDLVTPFPRQDAVDRTTGDTVIGALCSLLARRVDAEAVERTGLLPDGVLDDLRERGFLRAGLATGMGGLELSPLNVFRMVSAAAAHSLPAAMVLAVENGFGLGALLGHLRPGPLRDFVEERVRSGTLSGLADTEAAGASNLRRLTTAAPAGDEQGFLLDGEKLFVGNAPVADHLIVSATVREHGAEHRRLLIVDTRAPGVRIVAQDFAGVRGFPIGRVVCERVPVPADRVVTEGGDDSVRLTPVAATMARRGRVLLTAAPSLALAGQCLTWSREFVRSRTIDGRPLGDYPEIQRRLARSAAEVFALEAVAEWVLLADSEPARADTRLEQSAIKNIGTGIAARVVDRTVALLAGEGYETVASKRRRGARRPFPVERALRDLWAFRIAGGVDFHFDQVMSRQHILPHYLATAAPPAPARQPQGDDGERMYAPAPGPLSARNQRHLRFLTGQVTDFSRICRALVARHPDETALYADARPLILLNRLANEVLTSSLALARAAAHTAAGRTDAQDLADVHCAGARHRIAGLRRELADADAPDYRGLAAGLLARPSQEPLDHAKESR
ncbi:acyl-CoA dehydrogenase family protein [Streptomyces sp. NPDC060210]|uniref:acyl-CoA dehydrogenase family protein n=1 Tax=Streptomyces sp. NPDC060210 TaxID=3347074 RepID=UPI003651CA20